MCLFFLAIYMWRHHSVFSPTQVPWIPCTVYWSVRRTSRDLAASLRVSCTPTAAVSTPPATHATQVAATAVATHRKPPVLHHQVRDWREMLLWCSHCNMNISVMVTAVYIQYFRCLICCQWWQNYSLNINPVGKIGTNDTLRMQYLKF